MGGSGSGRYAWRNAGTADGRYSLDVNALHRAKVLVVGISSVWRWTGSDGSSGSVNLRCDGHALTVSFSVNGVSAREVVRLEQRGCHFGGLRTWFRCPHCARRVGKVYLSSARFVCRKCARLAYRSQRVDLSERGWRKIRKAYRALGLDPDEAERLENLPKPKGMHWTTFNRHFERLKHGAEMVDQDFLGAVAAISRRVGR